MPRSEPLLHSPSTTILHSRRPRGSDRCVERGCVSSKGPPPPEWNRDGRG
jgi:hypothetical protein